MSNPESVDRETVDRNGRLATPDTGRGRGVVVLCESGCEALLGEACGRLARHGFVAFAPVLPASEEDAIQADERAAVDAAIHALFCQDATDGAQVGVLGFGRGGRLALDAASRGARVGAVVMFGGAPPAGEANSWDAVEGPVLAVFAEKDAGFEEGRASALEEGLQTAAVPCEVQVASGATPEYLDPARPDHYDAVAARASWDAALALFRAELGWRTNPPSRPRRDTSTTRSRSA